MTIQKPERPEPVRFGPESRQLPSFLDYYRSTLLDKCSGLTFEQLATRAVPPSNLTLLGLLRHMTLVEQWWFQQCFAGLDVELSYMTPDDPDGDFNDLSGASLDEVERNYLDACARSRALCQDRSLDEFARRTDPGHERDLRWIHVHMIEEYARHCGHADLLRECIDGETGD